MATRETSASTQQSKVEFALKCHDWLCNLEQQKLCATEMIDRVREMCDQAKQMRKPARNFIWP